MEGEYRPVPLDFRRLPVDEQLTRARDFTTWMRRRRTVRSFSQRHIKHYYVNESVGIACGFLLAALHWAGLATLTHTPSPMGFLAEVLQRPKNEKPYLLVPVGYPASDAVVPAIERKSLDVVRIGIGIGSLTPHPADP